MSAVSSIGFTAGGIDVASIVSGLMTAERAPETALSTRQAAVTLQSAALGRLRSSLQTLQNQAAALVASGVTKRSSSTSSSAVSASMSSTAGTGALSFTVDALARAHGLRTASTVASSSTVVTTASSLALSSTAARLGISSIGLGAGVANGSYKVVVTQATAGATQVSTAALGTSTVIDGSNNTLDVQIDGVARSLTLTAGTYTASGLASTVQNALDATGGGATASVDALGRLRVVTRHEGSSASLQIVGGNAMATLNLSAASSTGVDGAIQIGSGAPIAVTSAGTGASLAIPTGSGDLTMRFGDGLRLGEATVGVVSTGDRSLGAVAAAINGSNVGVSAAAVKVSDGAWLLQLNSTHTGTAAELSLDASAFAGLGGVVETTAAQDAKITIGSGAGAYSVLSSTNSFSDVMPGVTLTANSLSTDPVTVTVGRDDSATADAVGALVAAATSLLADIAMQTKYDSKTNTASPLSSNSSVRQMADQIRAAVTSIVGNSSLAGTAGITTKRDGTLAFDRTKFMAALDADPAGVERLFARGGSTVGGVSWAAATDNTVSGSYAIQVTTAPTRATTGDVLVGGSVAGQTIGVRVGTTTASFVVPPGSSPADIVTGLNAALADAGLKVNAEASGGGVRLTAVGFGGAGTFDTNLDLAGGGSWATSAGADVVGTIDGRPAIGVGNRLSLLDGDTSPARGLGVDVGEGISGAIGSLDYQPGIAARISALATTLTATNGALTISATTYDKRIADFNTQIDAFELRMTAKEAQYRRQWTAVQSSLSTLQSQGSWLSSQISSLSTSYT